MLTAVLGLVAIALLVRSVQLQVFDKQFFVEQGDMRHVRKAPMIAHRGTIVDRFGEPLAVSSPVDSVFLGIVVLSG